MHIVNNPYLLEQSQVQKLGKKHKQMLRLTKLALHGEGGGVEE